VSAGVRTGGGNGRSNEGAGTGNGTTGTPRKDRGFPPAESPLPGAVVDNHTHLPLLAPDGSPLDPDDPGIPGGADPIDTATPDRYHTAPV
jgi:hypothetical protein